MAAGDLDTSFDDNGKKAVSFGGTDQAFAVLVQRNGRIVVAGGGGAPGSSFCAARLRSNGALDKSFDDNGKKIVNFGGDSERAFGAALQPDGKIVLVGDADLDAGVARLNKDGSLDTTFSGDGRRKYKWGSLSRAMDVIVLRNGKLVLAGFTGPEGGNMQVARIKRNGAPDTAFGTGGRTSIDFGGDDFGFAAARQPNGRIVIAGLSRPTLSNDPPTAVVARVRSTGVLDPDFNGDGRKVLTGMGTARDVIIQPDRKILVAGNPPDSPVMMVMRLDPNGTPDTTLGGDGTATIDFGAGVDFCNAMALQPDGKIVLVGSIAGGLVAVARLNSDGSPDGTFSTDGRATIDFGDPTGGNAVALQKNGRIVVAGYLTANENFAVARLRG
ncbi:MAG TPA: hypothetical protein VKD21_03835 [Acidimicrobiales bacterium]|nr:hypothetical protein [Acidimicrobiales bacterium]